MPTEKRRDCVGIYARFAPATATAPQKAIKTKATVGEKPLGNVVEIKRFTANV